MAAISRRRHDGCLDQRAAQRLDAPLRSGIGVWWQTARQGIPCRRTSGGAAGGKHLGQHRLHVRSDGPCYKIQQHELGGAKTSDRSRSRTKSTLRGSRHAHAMLAASAAFGGLVLGLLTFGKYRPAVPVGAHGTGFGSSAAASAATAGMDRAGNTQPGTDDKPATPKAAKYFLRLVPPIAVSFWPALSTVSVPTQTPRARSGRKVRFGNSLA